MHSHKPQEQRWLDYLAAHPEGRQIIVRSWDYKLQHEVVRELIKSGYVERIPSSKIHYYKLTPKGREAQRTGATRHER